MPHESRSGPPEMSSKRLTSGSDDEGNETTRPLGLIVARGTLLVLISPLDGSEEIENPFQQASEE